ncbi:MAG: DUF3368 domain-containing protein [Actinobacteria bacterium]|nr:DUF3368 domain-containing protein [Actinomycetota bacterium]
MNEIVSNAAPLIYLAIAGQMDLVKKTYKKIYISREARIEVVDNGKKLKKVDALIIEKEIVAGWIEVCEVKKTMDIPIELDRGEEATLILARDKDIKEVLIDDAPGRAAAIVMGLIPRGTLYILLKLLIMKEIDFNRLIKILEALIKKGFRLKEEIYLRVIEEARRISGF